MSKRLCFIIPFLVLVLVFGFIPLTSCKAEEIIEEPVKKEIVEPIEEEIEIVEEEKEQEQIQEQPQEQEEEVIIEEPAEEEPIKEEPKQAQYCGSINSNVYHYPSCHYVDRIKPENLIWFIDANDAKSKGYRPCKKCNPPG